MSEQKRDSEGYAKGTSRDGMGRLYVTNADDNELVLVFYIHADASNIHMYTSFFLFPSNDAKTRRSVARARVTL